MDKIPMPETPRKLFLPISFWSQIITHLDKKVQILIEEYGYGETGMTMKIHKEKVVEINFTDEVRLRNLIKQTGVHGNMNAPQADDSTVAS